LLFVAVAALFCGVSPGEAGTNHALTFDGTDDFVEVADPLPLTSGFTLEAWVLVVDASGSGRIISNWSALGGYSLDVFEKGNRVMLRLALGDNVAATTNFEANVGVWTHLAATWPGPGGAPRLYVDGVLRSEGEPRASIGASTGPFLIGHLPGSTSLYFHGSIDEVRVFDVALDENTIGEWMSREADPSHPHWSDLAGYWRFDEADGQVAESVVGSSLLDGRLGRTVDVDPADPAWEENAAPLPVEATTFGEIKALYRE
jgi:hypothetical protein